MAFIFSLRLPYVVKKTKSLHLIKIRGTKINTAFKRGPKKVPNDYFYHALKSVLDLADVGVLHGDGDGPRTPPRCLERSGKRFK